MSEELKIDLVRVQERIGAVQAAAEKAHSRIDGLQAEIKTELSSISQDVKLLLANYHSQKGSKTMLITLITLGIALIGALAKLLIKG